ncbi:hypothetical protein BC833DRAFT_571969 [Globomyces pollinis-pini]|nr:hypothetical protein BC833DRAFT_571969 [Globomyces pollinis-pini]
MKSTAPNKNETWPTIYKKQIDEIGFYDYCGHSPWTEDDCCYSYMDNFNESNNSTFLSGRPRIQQTNTDPFVDFPVMANEKMYCNVTSAISNKLTGYNYVMFLASGECIDDLFRCDQNGSFKVYSLPGCKGTVNLHQTKNTKDGSSNFLKIENGTTTSGWISQIPESELAPNTLSLNDCIRNACLFFTLISSIVLFYFVLRNALSTQKFFYQYVAFTQLLWVIYAVFQVYYYHYTDHNHTFQSILFAIIEVLYNVASLSTVVQTAILFFTFTARDWSILSKSVIAASLLISHLLFGGGAYFAYCTNRDALYCIPDTFLYEWLALYQYWILVLFVWDTITPVLIVLELINKSHNTKVKPNIRNFLQIIHNTDRQFWIYLTVQIYLGTLFMVTGYIICHTRLLGDDLTSVTVETFQYTLLSIHSAVNILQLNRLVHIMQSLSRF